MLDDFFRSETLSEDECQEYSGTYEATLKGKSCKLELSVNPNKVFKGWLNCKDQCFELKGKLNQNKKTYYGFLLDPEDHLPFAYLKAQKQASDLSFELGIPDFEELFKNLDTEKFFFHKGSLERLELFLN